MGDNAYERLIRLCGRRVADKFTCRTSRVANVTRTGQSGRTLTAKQHTPAAAVRVATKLKLREVTTRKKAECVWWGLH